MIGVGSARELLDFGGRVSDQIADGQLEGAVAIHNILERQRVAYLADEVGMGKTYVALGVLALFRHFDPTFRAMIIAPRENLQRKWKKETLNFVANNVRFSDLRVRAPHGAPVRSMVSCRNLLALIREVTLDPDRDFLMRLPSFSLGGSAHEEGWRARRDELLRYLPWLDPALFDLRGKDRFRDNFARALCCALPDIDLLIVDEGHNLKGGVGSGAVRNRMLALALGGLGDGIDRRRFPGYGPRVKRLLFLSATPVENDYVQLWHQLDVFGFARNFDVLRDADATDDEKKVSARRFLIRRLARTRSPLGELTKNQYRREWRGGGVDLHDEPLTVPDARQRLVVALVQKKVSETIRSPRFKNSFQIGMLASFESFLETMGLKKPGGGPSSNFDDADQTDDELELLGADVPQVNRLASSYRKKFDRELPHPKMDGVVDALDAATRSGEKALVFVRRVASVRELKRRLDDGYDDALFDRLRSELLPPVWTEMEEVIRRYRDEKSPGRRRRPAAGAGEPAHADPVAAALDDELLGLVEDQGGRDTFFDWFFRGEGPPDVFSGATLQRRFSSTGSVLSTFFDHNHVAWLLGVHPRDAATALGEYLELPSDRLFEELSARASNYLSGARKPPRQTLFRSFQRAAVELLAGADGRLRARAEVLRQLRYSWPTTSQVRQATGAEEYLGLETFFTALRERPDLERRLLHERLPVPDGAAGNGASPGGDRSASIADERKVIREHELRRELLSAVARLGHPSIDLFVLVANRAGTLAIGSRDAEGSDRLAEEWLDLLAAQQNRDTNSDASSRASTKHTAFLELAAVADHFDLLLDVNAPEVRTADLDEATTRFGRLMREQQPVGGMAGQVNETLVRQFRMPGYPFVLITTDLLREGEDLHTFCSQVYHYGISWMPSSMEQRIGRIDRVNSHTYRRLRGLRGHLDGEHLLQVYLPHLRDTIEVLQVERVLDRMNRFMQLMHEDLRSVARQDGRLSVPTAILEAGRDIAVITEPLQTAFPVPEWALQGEDRPLATTAGDCAALVARFNHLQRAIREPDIRWHDAALQPPNELIGEVTFDDGRRQRFVLFLRPVDGWYAVRCVSPVGKVDPRALAAARESSRGTAGTRITVVPDDRVQAYRVAVEGAVLLATAEHDAVRVARLIRAVAVEADAIEDVYLMVDEVPDRFDDSLTLEIDEDR